MTSEAAGGHDRSARKVATRPAGRARGVHIYVTADDLKAAGIDPDGPPPFYRAWGTKGGGVMVRLYRSR